MASSEDRLAERAVERGPFERFAERASELVSGAAFFAACLLLVLIWAPSYLGKDVEDLKAPVGLQHRR